MSRRDLAVGEAPKGLGGVDFSSWLRNSSEPPRDHVISTWARDDGENADLEDDLYFAVRTRRHRLIRYGADEFELYDHRVDPYEWDNIARQAGQRALVANLNAKLEAIDPAPRAVRRDEPETAD